MSSRDGKTKTHLLGAELPESEIEDGVSRAEFGVLGLSKAGETYSFPVSFGYDEGLSTLYFMMAFDTESRKRAFLETTSSASFVVTETTLPDSWQSILFSGPITPVSADETEQAYTALADTAVFPAPHTFQEFYDLDSVEQTLYQLDVTSRSIRSAPTRQ